MAESNERSVPHGFTFEKFELEYGTYEAPGYHTLASLMGRGEEYAFFRKFSSLNMLNLMRYQAELLDLEEQYKVAIFTNEKGSKNLALATCFKELNASESKQKEILDKIRTKLCEYNSALVLCSQVISLSTPRKSGLRFLKYWLYGSNDGEGKGFLTKSSPEEILAWSDDHDRDFVAIRGESDGDSSGDVWTSKIVTALLRLCTPGRGKRRKEFGSIEFIRFKSPIGIIVTVLSAIVPALSVLALFFEKNLLNRIWIMIGLTMAFATILSVFTAAKRIEIFSAVAAFAAVEVIFIGSTDVGNKLATATG